MPACGNDDVLLSFPNVSHWRRLSAGRKAALPEFLARLRVERTQIVVQRRADEHETRRRNDRSSERGRSSSSNEVFREWNHIFGRTKRHRPEYAAVMHIDGMQKTPGRR